ncbi:kinetochore Sim4 complex subunit FTA2-domain-containing protein [Nemania sp. FL0031]|nr:kinetochore Sim4 complex subunit FTA2-domain-containing protein [Nemania sp. FL0031]
MVRYRVKASPAASLPPCPGPKLHPFEHQNALITWGPRLDKNRINDNDNQAFVFQVEIASRRYAIKVFKFFHPASSKYYWETYLGESYPLRKIIFYTDPFYAECRAYGRIKQARDERQVRTEIATRCHGYLFLTPKDMRWLEKERGVDLCAGVIDKDLKLALGGDLRARAIVKDLETGDKGLNRNNIWRAWRNVSLQNSLNIYNRDVRVENFMNCRIVDFGSSWTEPHVILDSVDADEAREQRLSDCSKFDEMTEEEGIKTSLKTPTSRHNLRSRKRGK